MMVCHQFAALIIHVGLSSWVSAAGKSQMRLLGGEKFAGLAFLEGLVFCSFGAIVVQIHIVIVFT